MPATGIEYRDEVIGAPPDLSELQPTGSYLVGFDEPIPREDAEEILRGREIDLAPGWVDTELVSAVVTANRGGDFGPDDLSAILESGNVRYASPIYEPTDWPGMAVAPAPGVVAVKYDGQDSTRERLDEIASRVGEDAIFRLASSGEFGDDIALYVQHPDEPVSVGEPSYAMQLRDFLAGEQGVEWAELDWLALDPRPPLPENLPPGQPTASASSLAFGLGPLPEPIPIAVLDSDFDLQHSALQFADPALWYNGVTGTQNIDPPKNAHGTLCAGVAAADSSIAQLEPNEVGVDGAAPGAHIVPVVCFLEEHRRDAKTSTLAACIRWVADHGIPVASISLAGYGSTQLLADAVQYADNRGTVLVAGSGNLEEGKFPAGQQPTDEDYRVRYPARFDKVIAVGAATIRTADRGQARLERIDWDSPEVAGAQWGSCFGSRLDCVAQGVLVPATDLVGDGGVTTTDYWYEFLGTSAATPTVAGLVAHLVAATHAPPLEIRHAIYKAAQPLAGYEYQPMNQRRDEFWNVEVGHGMIDPRLTLEIEQREAPEGPISVEVTGESTEMGEGMSCKDGPRDDQAPGYLEYEDCLKPLTSFLEALGEEDNLALLHAFWNSPYTAARNAGVPWSACILLGSGSWDEVYAAVAAENGHFAGQDPASGSNIVPIWVRA